MMITYQPYALRPDVWKLTDTSLSAVHNLSVMVFRYSNSSPTLSQPKMPSSPNFKTAMTVQGIT